MTEWAPNWSAILQDLPEATHARVRGAVEAARVEYFAVDNDVAFAAQGHVWQAVVDYAAGRKIQGFCDLVAQLEPANCAEAIALRALVDGLKQVREKARKHAVLFRHQKRKEWFYAAVLHAWADANDGNLGQTTDGPAARFLCAVSAGISSLSGRGAKEVIRRVQKQRQRQSRPPFLNDGQWKPVTFTEDDQYEIVKRIGHFFP